MAVCFALSQDLHLVVIHIVQFPDAQCPRRSAQPRLPPLQLSIKQLEETQLPDGILVQLHGEERRATGEE